MFVLAASALAAIITSMNKTHASVTKLPDAPGVYIFIGANREVLYVGKATSLRDRVRSYFGSDLAVTRGAHMVRMVEEAKRVDFRTTDSVLEALVLEAHLIKELKPRFNTRDKDDKSFNYLVLTAHEDFPRLLTVRGKDLIRTLHALKADGNVPVYGPFPHAGQLKAALKIIRKIFTYYDTTQPVTELRDKNDRKLRFNESIGVYPPADITKREYARTIRHLKLFFTGKKQQLVSALERDMMRHAHAHRFEAAEKVKRQLFALQHINDVSIMTRQTDRDASNNVRIEGYDVAHLAGKDMVGVMTVVEGGEVNKTAYRTFTIRSVEKSNDTGALREMLGRRLVHHEWNYPQLIVVDGGKAQYNAARAVLREAGVMIPVVAVTKDDHHRPRSLLGPVKLRNAHHADILLANAEAHRFSLATHKRKRGKRIRG